MDFSKSYVRIILGLAFILILMIFRILERNYRAALSDFYSASVTEQSRHPELTGISGLYAISFRTSNGLKIAGWYVPSKNHAAIVAVAGANVDHSFVLPELRILSNSGFGVLSFDWPGSGASEGEVHWGVNEREALTAAIDWIITRNNVDPKKIGGFGHSMGGYMMAQVAAHDPRIGAILLAATPPDYSEYVLWGHRRWGFLSQFPAEYAVKQSGMPVKELIPKEIIKLIAPRPVLILGGDLDPEVPEFMTKELYNSASQPKNLWIVHGAAHSGYIEAAPQEFPARLVEFFSRTLLSK